MLNYSYGVLESGVHAQLLAVGLDPTIGYLHGSYRDKYALVFDITEPLRPIADLHTLQLVQKRALEPGVFTMRPDGRLNPGLAASVVRSQQENMKAAAIVNRLAEVLSSAACCTSVKQPRRWPMSASGLKAAVVFAYRHVAGAS
jgi:CRISPR/Cas system-associated endonuclease Cas1